MTFILSAEYSWTNIILASAAGREGGGGGGLSEHPGTAKYNKQSWDDEKIIVNLEEKITLYLKLIASQIEDVHFTNTILHQ